MNWNQKPLWWRRKWESILRNWPGFSAFDFLGFAYEEAIAIANLCCEDVYGTTREELRKEASR